MGDAELHLEPLSWGNIGDIMTEGPVSSTPYYELPATYLEALKKMTMLDKIRDLGMGNEFAAYTDTEEYPLVGGGEVMCILGRLTLGYWVATNFRRAGLGTSITGRLEAYAAESFPGKQHIEADIHSENLRSQSFARAIGFEPTGRQTPKGLHIFRKRLEHGTINTPQRSLQDSATLHS